MAVTPEMAPFPRFRELKVKSLLYYQCQLKILQVKLHGLEYADRERSRDWEHAHSSGCGYKPYYNKYADTLVKSNSEQFQTVKEIRVFLKEYNGALFQYSQICALQDPEPYYMRALRTWLQHRDYGNFEIRGSLRLGLENIWGSIGRPEATTERSLWLQFFHLVWTLIRGLVWRQVASNGELDPAGIGSQTKLEA
ncbi:hypothetical protein K458DRAFT_141822 [Lentithecium fluviatile CBS 122367]|uniref:DUF6594 domain-containing protein n=1 Tax=Lentithecium fluviatile CBS 122367 TaxID=1168545 RepID=A0A6G1IIT5_9PLEO|nr:hypothetical protein K458DRAFT_141822 [Lentithecium fluviatile CBS 122367]